MHSGLFSPAAAPDRPEPGARPRLLIVDDELLLAEYLASLAEDEGWTVELALNAADFEAKLAASQPDLVVLDLAMPDRDGVELLRHLSSHSYLGNLIIASACDAAVVETSAMLAREQGLAVAGYLQKPVAADEFTTLLTQLVAMLPDSALDRGHQ